MKQNLLFVCFLLACFLSKAQSKVFKEVSDEISSQVNVIKQDNALVGYLVFTRLEKASTDSFNYRITIIDENLNDIGTVNFKDENLILQAVAFEQDVLCLSYLKSNVIGTDFKNRKEYKRAMNNAKNFVLTQFLGLNGKTINVNTAKVDINVERDLYNRGKLSGTGSLKHSLQLRNIPGKGFASFYGDEQSNLLSVYDLSGKEVWKKKVSTLGKAFYLHTSNDNIYLLSKNEGEKIEGGYEVTGYNYADNIAFDKYTLKDRKGNSLKVLGFDNDPATGKAYLTGTIISPEMNGLYTMKDVTKGPYAGVFTINLNGPKRADYKETFSYWNTGANAAISDRGKVVESDAYSLLTNGFKDYQGNTYFVGSSVIRRIKWGSIVSSVVLAPLFVVSPLILIGGGTTKCKVTDAMLLKQNTNGTLTYDNTIPCNSTSFRPGRAPLNMYGPQKSFYHVANSDTKNDYVIVDDIKDIVIYNVTGKKVAKTIPHKNGGIRTFVYPAKEGHVMVAEYNKNEKYTRVSIESL